MVIETSLGRLAGCKWFATCSLFNLPCGGGVESGKRQKESKEKNRTAILETWGKILRAIIIIIVVVVVFFKKNLK